MTFIQAVSLLTQAVYFCVAIYVVFYTAQRPTRSNLHILLFFSLLAFIVMYSWVQEAAQLIPAPIGELIGPTLVFSLPYVLLRLADHYTTIRPLYSRLAEVGLLVSVGLLVWPGIENPFILLTVVSYFSITTGFAARQFYDGAQHANGITRTRLRAVAWATIALSVGLFTVVLATFIGGPIGTGIEFLRQILLLCSAVLYLMGFAPPPVLRQGWQEPELRQFLRQTLQLPQSRSEHRVLRQIEEVTAETIGAPRAAIGLWNETTASIDFSQMSFKPGQTIGGRAFQENRPLLSLDTVADDPESQEIYEAGQAYAVMAAPIQWDGKPQGVIALYSPNPPIFAEDDLSLLQLLADQIGVLLQNRRHLEAEAELAAREESARLKDEFLSVAAHDLKTPLTTILATGQYLERRLTKHGADSPELRSVVRLNHESRRLQSFVQGLLDASRIEQGKLLANIEPANISELLHEVLDRAGATDTHKLAVNIEDGLIAEADYVRMQQVIENLLENARKYSPVDSTISLEAWHENGNVCISVSDSGVGIHPDEQERIFDRYFRSEHVETGDAPGIGLGLYICKAIVEQHGGHIWVESTLGEGSTFHVRFRGSRISLEEHVAVDTRR